MLTMNLAQLNRAELADAISHQCGQFGDVKTITILKPPEHPETAFALVSMASADALERIVHELGGAKVTSLAVIRIEQEPPAIPASLLATGTRHYTSVGA